MRILLVHETDHDVERLLEALLREGDTVRSVAANAVTLLHEIEAWKPELLLIAADDPSRDMVEQICVVSQERDRPIVMFTEADDADSMRSLVKAGVAAYVVAGFKPERLRSVINVAVERFEHEREQHAALRDAQKRAEDDRAIARAKSYLQRQGHTESEAYAELRSRRIMSITTIARRWWSFCTRSTRRPHKQIQSTVFLIEKPDDELKPCENIRVCMPIFSCEVSWADQRQKSACPSDMREKRLGLRRAIWSASRLVRRSVTGRLQLRPAKCAADFA